MRPLGTMLVAAGMACAAAAVHRALFSRNRRPDAPKPFSDEWMRQEARDFATHRTGSAPLTHHQTDESVRWHLSRAEARRIRRAYRRMRLDIDSRLDNPAWPHPSTGRSA
jgi:hypothetical protein